MAVHIVGIQVDGDQHLIPVAPHLPRCLLTNHKRLLRRDLTLFEALDAVVAHHFSPQTEPPLHGDHLGIGVLRRTVDAANEHLAVCFVIVSRIAQGGV